MLIFWGQLHLCIILLISYYLLSMTETIENDWIISWSWVCSTVYALWKLNVLRPAIWRTKKRALNIINSLRQTENIAILPGHRLNYWHYSIIFYPQNLYMCGWKLKWLWEEIWFNFTKYHGQFIIWKRNEKKEL